MSSRKSKKQSASSKKSVDFSYGDFPESTDFSVALKYAKKCIKNPQNEVCKRMPPTAEDNIRLGLKRSSFSPQMRSTSEIRPTLVMKTRGGKTRKNKTRKHKR